MFNISYGAVDDNINSDVMANIYDERLAYSLYCMAVCMRKGKGDLSWDSTTICFEPFL